jgi:hypothetical protein
MIHMHALWLPTLLSAVVVFLASSVIHMALQWWHRSDYPKLAQEDKVMELLKPLAIPPGDYMVPGCSGSAEMRTPEFKQKMMEGPIMMLTVVQGGPIKIGGKLALWFLYLLVVTHLAGYVAGHALPFGAGHKAVFRIIGVTSFLGFSAALWQMSIWYQRSWLTTLKITVDGLLYAALTAGTFACFWPR